MTKISGQRANQQAHLIGKDSEAVTTRTNNVVADKLSTSTFNLSPAKRLGLGAMAALIAAPGAAARGIATVATAGRALPGQLASLDGAAVGAQGAEALVNHGRKLLDCYDDGDLCVEPNWPAIGGAIAGVVIAAVSISLIIARYRRCCCFKALDNTTEGVQFTHNPQPGFTPNPQPGFNPQPQPMPRENPYTNPYQQQGAWGHPQQGPYQQQGAYQQPQQGYANPYGQQGPNPYAQQRAPRQNPYGQQGYANPYAQR